MLGLILDASVIILQITTTKYHSHPTVQMFFEDPTILGMVCCRNSNQAVAPISCIMVGLAWHRHVV